MAIMMIFAQAPKVPELPQIPDLPIMPMQTEIMWFGMIFGAVLTVAFWIAVFFLIRMAIKGRSGKADRLLELELKFARLEGRREGELGKMVDEITDENKPKPDEGKQDSS